MPRYDMSKISTARRARDCWWVVLVADPIAARIVWFLANFTPVHPLIVTGVSLLLYATSATLFALFVVYAVVKPWALYVAAICYLLAFVLDCVDGELARLTKKTTVIGRYLDRIGGFFGETAVLAAFTCAALEYWPVIPTVIFGVVYWAGMAVEVSTWFHSRNITPEAPDISWRFNNRALQAVDDWLRKRRLGSHPSAVEGGVLAFGVSPFFHMHPAFLGVGAFLVWIDQFRFIAKRFIRTGKGKEVREGESL